MGERNGRDSPRQERSRVKDAWLRPLLEAAPDALVIIDSSGSIAFVNTLGEELFGYDAGELLDQPVEILIPERLQGSHRAHRDTYFAEPTTRPMGTGLALSGRRKDGTEFPIEISLAPIKTEDGVLATAAIRDVTERDRQEHELRAFAAKLDLRNRELQDFAYLASHDLQEPLRKLRTFGSRLQARYALELGMEGRNYLERMEAAAQRMQEMIQSLLEYSHITSEPRPHEPVDLRAEAERALEALQDVVERTSARVEIGELPTIAGDRRQIRQLFDNLMSNAIKFHREGVPPRVTISCRAGAAPGTWEIDVADNGIGFTEHQEEKVFQIFRRLVHRHDYDGSGVGLAICRKIAETHGGVIRAKGVPNEGAIFTLTLPATP